MATGADDAAFGTEHTLYVGRQALMLIFLSQVTLMAPPRLSVLRTLLHTPVSTPEPPDHDDPIGSEGGEEARLQVSTA